MSESTAAAGPSAPEDAMTPGASPTSPDAPPASRGQSGRSILDTRFPPVAELVVASVALMLAGGIYLAAHLPVPPPLGPAVGLVVAGGVLTLAAVALLLRIRPFAWGKFFLVWRWALLAYAVIAGMLAYVFVLDHTRGATLGVLVVTLAVFAIDVPTVIAFTVARYDAASVPEAGR